MGIACYSRMMKRIGRHEEAQKWNDRAHVMAANWLERARGERNTALTFDGNGWSMKYNLVWDLVLGLELLPKEFYSAETESYLPLINEFGLPLDSRADYTKSDWTVWVRFHGAGSRCIPPDDRPAGVLPAQYPHPRPLLRLV